MMRCFVWIACLFACASLTTLAQDNCPHGDNAGEALADELSHAKSCSVAADKLNDCRWGSSADANFAPIVVHTCEKEFLRKLSGQAKSNYTEELQLCAYEYARQRGSLSISEAAMCEVYVAAEIAKNPASAIKSLPRASFDCKKAQAPLEVAICSDIKLGRADVVLGRVYSGTVKSLTGATRQAFIESEKHWLKSIPEKCKLSVPSISQGALECVRNEFELRFSAIDECGVVGGDEIVQCLEDTSEDKREDDAAITPRASFGCGAPSDALQVAICADSERGEPIQNHSVRSASVGFSLEARCAGSQTAMRAATPSTSGTVVKTAGSHCLTP
jgi:hypothetical protein